MQTPIINYTNILQPLQRETRFTTARNKTEILAELQYDIIAYDLIIVKNGIVTSEDFEVEPNDIISVQIVPKGGGMGNVLRMVAMIAIAVLAPEVGAFAGGLAFESGAIASYGMVTGVYYGAMIGTVIAGGMLVNAILPQSTPSLNGYNNSIATSNTYGWDSATNSSTQGTVIPITFGTHKVTPPLIGRYLESIDDKQYINLMYALNDGQITDISNIKLNDESISNFDSVNIDIRYGSNSQIVIPYFNDSRFDKSVGKKLDTTFTVATTNRSDVTEITAVISFPKGLFYMNDNAQAENYSAKLVVEYSLDGINWIPMYNQTTISGYSEYYQYDHDGNYYYKYDINGNFLDYITTLPSNIISFSNGTNTIIGRSTYYSPIYGLPYSYLANYETITSNSTSAFRKTFTRKNLTAGQYQIRARLYDSLIEDTRHGSDVYFEYLEECISDDFIYPSTALLSIRALATDQLNGSIPTVTCNITANSNNPALICKKILLDSGDDLSNIDTATFSEWETECNTYGYVCNIVFDSEFSVRNALDTVSLLGRASVQQFGSKYVVIMDKKNILPVRKFTFGMGNILSNTFKQTYLPIADRANVIEVTFYDENNSYERTVFELSNAKYDNVVDRKVSQLNLVGCTNKSMALKHAQYQLNSNRYLSETIEFEAFNDSFNCKYGDIIGVSHDIPQYGFSGRIESKVGNIITLDRYVTFEIGKSYGIILRNSSNNIEEINVTGSGTTNQVTLSTASTYTYAQYDNYSFGEVNKTNKLYRIVKISTGSELTRTVTAIEYNQNVYNDDITINIPQISDLGLRSLFISDYIRYKQNTNDIEVVANLKWTGTSIYYDVMYKKSSDNIYTTKRLNDTYVDIAGLESGVNYDFIIKDDKGHSLSQTYKIIGKFAPPPKISNLRYSFDTDSISLQWDYNNKPIDFKQFNIYDSYSNLIGITETNLFKIPLTSQKANYSINAVDTSNIISENVTINTSIPFLNDVQNFTSYFNKNGEIELSWSQIDSTYSPIIYEIRKGLSWSNGQVVANVTDKFYKPSGQGNYYIKAKYTNIYGFDNYSQNATELILTGSNLVKNVIFTADEKATGFSGTLTNCRVYNDSLFGTTLILNPASNNLDTFVNIDTIANLDYPNGCVLNGTYELSTHSITLAYSQRIGIDFNYKVYGINLDDNIDLIPNFDLIDNLDGDIQNTIKVTPQIKLDSGSWQNYILGDYVATTFQFRLLIETTNARIIPIVTACNIVSDVPDKVLQGTNISVGTSGLNVVYSNAFNTDSVNVQITILNTQSGDYATVTGSNKSGFTVNCYNGASLVARTINWISQAY